MGIEKRIASRPSTPLIKRCSKHQPIEIWQDDTSFFSNKRSAVNRVNANCTKPVKHRLMYYQVGHADLKLGYLYIGDKSTDRLGNPDD